MRLDLASLWKKLVIDQRGGYCFEQNTLFAAVLEAIGFPVRRLAARVRMGAAGITEMCIRDRFWLCPGVGMVAFSLIALQDVLPAIRLPILGVSVLFAGIGAAYLVIHLVEQDRKHPGLQ